MDDMISFDLDPVVRDLFHPVDLAPCRRGCTFNGGEKLVRSLFTTATEQIDLSELAPVCRRRTAAIRAGVSRLLLIVKCESKDIWVNSVIASSLDP